MATTKRHTARMTSYLLISAILLALGVSLTLGARTAKADEPDMVKINEQALQIIAESGQTVTHISLGGEHSAAITSDGSLYTWGNGYCGQLGYETYSGYTAYCSFTPKKVSGLSDVVAVSLGYAHSAAITSDGSLYTWGYNGSGQLGDGTTNNSVTPKKVSGLSDVVAVSLGRDHSAAITSDGSLYTWGYNGSGQLGDGTKNNNLTPQKVSGLSDVVAVSLGYEHSAAVTSDGTLYTWGDNGCDQLGYETYYENRYDSLTPQKVSGISNVVAVSLGGEHSAALTSDGTLYTWGSNSWGQLGYETPYDNTQTPYNPTPQKVSDLSNVEAVSLGYGHSAALTSDGSLYTWGNNDLGQLGDGTIGIGGGWSHYSQTPQKVSGLSDVAAVSLGSNHSAAVTSDGSLYTWGHGGDGQLGYGSRSDKHTPTQILLNGQEMYRMYNPNSGEHLYTASASERDTMVGNGWNYEGVMWRAPMSSYTPIYRLYNPNNGDHHYARTKAEYDSLQQNGWKGEGVAFYSDDEQGVPIYRLFNPYQTGAGAHNYTDKVSERDISVSQGWEYEDIGWYGLK